MNFFETVDKITQGIAAGIITFLQSKAAPFVLALVLLVIAFFILRAIYRRLRDKNLYHITYERSFADQGVYAGDETELLETVANHGFFPLLRINIEGFLYNELRLTAFEAPKKDGMQFFAGRFNLWPYMRIRRRHKLLCLCRGYYAIESASVPTREGDYFLECPASIYVYPKPVPLSVISEASGRMQGEERAVRQLFSDPFTLSGVRDYRYGDPVSAINFKASARTWMSSGRSSSPLKVNDREFCANRRLAVFMDFHTERNCGIDGRTYNRRIEAGLSYASSLIREAIYDGFNAGFFCNCKQADGTMALRFPIESGEAHMLAIFRAMAQLRPADGASFQMLLDEAVEAGECDCEIYVITVCESDKTDDRLTALRRLGNSVRLIVLNEHDEYAVFGDEDEAKGGNAV